MREKEFKVNQYIALALEDDETVIYAGGIKFDTDSNKEQVIKIRCRACDTLNDENAKFCDQCGQPI